MARADQEDEFFEKDIEEVIPSGFHIVSDDDDEEEEETEGALDEVLAVEAGIEDDPLLEESEESVGDFGGKDFDFENEEEES
ncbi:MAG TPA: hypothetical protein PK886_00015 [Candidatus Paceibacterota bacterium]|nr:hypothetical protein [Candidatus Paceibacterota bacterium]